MRKLKFSSAWHLYCLKIETKELGINENSKFTILFAIFLIGAMGYYVLSFIYNHSKAKISPIIEKNINNESNDNTHYELLDAVSDGQFITEV